jgi:hypothetical protein
VESGEGRCLQAAAAGKSGHATSLYGGVKPGE